MEASMETSTNHSSRLILANTAEFSTRHTLFRVPVERPTSQVGYLLRHGLDEFAPSDSALALQWSLPEAAFLDSLPIEIHRDRCQLSLFRIFLEFSEVACCLREGGKLREAGRLQLRCSAVQ